MISSMQKVLSLVKWCFQQRVKKLTSVRQIMRDFSPTRNMTRMHVGLALSYVKLLLSSWKNICVQFDGMVYQQIMGIPMGTYCAPLIADLFIYCLREGFYVKPPEIQTVWPHRQVQTIPLDILTIYSPLITLHLLNTFPTYIKEKLQLNKANTSDKETSFLDLKLTCHHINRRHFCFNIISISVHPFTLDECHAWFHLYGLRLDVNKRFPLAKISKW